MNHHRGPTVAHAQTALAFDDGEDMPPWQDRADRLKTIFMVGRIITHSGDHLCRVRNISSGGMLVECETTLAMDETVKIELRNLNVITAQVRWIRGDRIGIQFDAPIEVADFLHKPTGSTLLPRAPRLGASCPVILWHIGRNHAATLLDVSQTGCRLELAGALPDGAEVRISIPGLPVRRGKLRWANPKNAGFSFNEALSFADLMAWDKARES